jgi:Domain of unknown function (DUF4105)
MMKKIFLLFTILCNAYWLSAQKDSSHIRISLLTCGVGDEVWETFGHTGVRVVDSNKGIDVVYNYGTFDGFDKDFEIKFMRGKLLYYVSMDTYDAFMNEYIHYKRGVEEQILLLTGAQKMQVYQYLMENALPENRNYKYDFFFDNCATRIRDIFPKVLGKDFRFGNTLPPHTALTFRDIINQYFYKRHWERVGVNILLGSKIDRRMTNEDIMFLPDYLRDGVGGGTVKGVKIATPSQVVLPARPIEKAGVNEPFWVMTVIMVLTLIGLFFKRLRILGNLMSGLLLFVSGLLGCIIVVMWLGTDHQACQNNFNVLWALPTNIIAIFVKKKSRYALLGMSTIFLALLLHLLHIQEMPLLEIGPFLFSLLCVFAVMYKRTPKMTA